MTYPRQKRLAKDRPFDELPVNTWEQVREESRRTSKRWVWAVITDQGDTGRAFRSAKAQVLLFANGRIVPTANEGDSHWMDRVFDATVGYVDLHTELLDMNWVGPVGKREAMARAAQRAIDWATNKYGAQDLVVNAVGDYVPAECRPLRPR